MAGMRSNAAANSRRFSRFASRSCSNWRYKESIRACICAVSASDSCPVDLSDIMSEMSTHTYTRPEASRSWRILLRSIRLYTASWEIPKREAASLTVSLSGMSVDTVAE
jgi:hypothetical protein